MKDGIKEDCGIFGIYNPDPKSSVSADVYTALYSLQHRGQESAGITVNNDGEMYSHRDVGLVSDVFNDMIINMLNGNFACGHVRCAAEGEASRDMAQPFVVKHTKGRIAVAMNGCLTNQEELINELSESGAVFQTNADTEIIAHIVSRERIKNESTERALINSIDKLKGAYSMVFLTVNKLIAVRDPYGMRPLCMGKLGNSIMFASESCAIDAVGGTFVRDIKPGEVVVVKNGGSVESFTEKCNDKGSFCIFEHIYFARPDSILDGQSVHQARRNAGRELAKARPVEADIVIGVPDSGTDAAIGYAEESGIKYSIGIIKNRYIGRTFLQKSQINRERSVKLKLNALASEVKGKRVIMVDDTIVRGTSSANLPKLLRDAGAREVHLRISSPPFLFPCSFGTDISSKNDLIANRLTKDEIREQIGADSLEYMPIEALERICPDSNIGFCKACFTGEFPKGVL